MNKPMSMSVKEFLIRTLTVKLAKNEKIIEAVVNHQFQSANEAMDLNGSIEISGFGKFMYNQNKAKKKLAKWEAKKKASEDMLASPDISEDVVRRHTKMLTEVTRQIELIKPTIDNYEL
jgi:nucleoid DNA-binding protein